MLFWNIRPRDTKQAPFDRNWWSSRKYIDLYNNDLVSQGYRGGKCRDSGGGGSEINGRDWDGL